MPESLNYDRNVQISAIKKRHANFKYSRNGNKMHPIEKCHAATLRSPKGASNALHYFRFYKLSNAALQKRGTDELFQKLPESARLR